MQRRKTRAHEVIFNARESPGRRIIKRQHVVQIVRHPWLAGAPTLSSRSANKVSSSGAGMENAIRHGPLDLLLGPFRMSHPETGGQQSAHILVHPNRLLIRACGVIAR